MKRYLVKLIGNHDIGRVIAISSAAASVLLYASLAHAGSRPGGGGSFSGGSKSSGGGGGRSSGGGSFSGSSSSGGGGGGGDGGAFVALVIEYPAIGIPILILIIIVYLVKKRAGAAMEGSEWSSGAGTMNWTPYAPPPQPVVVEPLRGKLEALRRTDPGFSIVVFEDFLYFLYGEMHRARGAAGGEALAAYVADHARAALHNDGRVAEVTGIIIGSLTYERVDVDAQGGVQIDVLVESNYVERYRPQGEQRYYVKDRLRLSRAPGARSRDPGKARTLNCPNCGGPLSNMRGTTCNFCKTTVPQGTKDWAVSSLQTLEREPKGPLLTSNVGEEGTNLPTVFDRNAQ
ncbi:MAG: putative rane protein, partial [Labilithrix sp.]|nr:putative rane protein [Labilithrix sp.]